MSSRRSSVADPLEESAYRTQSHHDHDMAGGSQLPPVHIARTRSGTTRSRSGSLFNAALGIKEEYHEEGEDGAASVSNTSGKGRKNSNANNRSINNNQGGKEVIEEHPDESESDLASLNEQQVQSYHGEESDLSKNDDTADVKSTKSSSSSRKREKKKVRNATIWKVALMFGRVYILIFTLFLGILSIYWGSLYNRQSHYHKINYLVVTEEQTIGQLPPLYSLTLQNVLASSQIKAYGTFHWHNKTDFEPLAQSHDNTIREEILRQVHHQNYWGGIYIPENITLDYYQALSSNSSFNQSIEFIYETGRNPQGVQSYVVSVMQSVEKAFSSAGAKSIVQRLMGQLSTDEMSTVLTSHSELLSPLGWVFTDNRPTSGAIIIGVVQIGLIYLLVLSFHQFNFAASTHEYIVKNVHTRQYLLYHYTVSQLAYLILSLIYSLMTLAFQIPLNKTFGRSGFLVEWAFVYLTMSALGGVNENVAIQIFARYKPVIGFWIVFFLCTNVSPIFSPMVVMNNFYRYGYALPMYNGNELLKIVFLDTYKGNMGRNIGILIVWIVLMNAILPFNLRNVRNYTRKLEAKAREALEKDKTE